MMYVCVGVEGGGGGGGGCLLVDGGFTGPILNYYFDYSANNDNYDNTY